MKFENSETLHCLINAYAGESMARNRYTIYAKKAKKENMEFISKIFLETADNELEHAKLFYKHIPQGTYIPTGSYPFFLGETYENLIESYKGEKEEWETIYKNCAQTAKDEGYDEISRLFNNISSIEKRHSHRFLMLAEGINKETLYKKEETTQWICLKCGHTHIGKEAPCKCPVCDHEQGYFMVFNENL